jgi:AcrR family transcriptional regulator
MSSTLDHEVPEAAPRGMRDAVIEAALQVIRERGLARTRTSHIARAAGCAEGSIYRYFSGKSELVREVLQSRLREVIGVLADLPLRAGTATVEANLLDAARAALASYGDGATLLGGLFADTELLAAERAFLAAHDVGPHAVAANLAAYLRAEQALGRVRPDADAEIAARLLLASCLGESLFRAIDTAIDATDQDRYLHGLVTTITDGLTPPARQPAGDRPARRNHDQGSEER